MQTWRMMAAAVLLLVPAALPAGAAYTAPDELLVPAATPAGGGWVPVTFGDPGIRQIHAMAADPVTGSAVLFGGEAGAEPPLGETWLLKSNYSWTPLSSPSSPEPRSSAGLASAGMTDTFVLFGGSSSLPSPAGFLGDTWLLDASNGTWSNISGGVSPRARACFAMVYDPGAGRVVLHGGCTGNQSKTWSLNDTWTLDPRTGTWTNVTPPSSPKMVLVPSSSYVGSGKTLVFGMSEKWTAETWIYNSGNNIWRNVTPVAGGPPVLRWSALAWAPGSPRVLMYGGYTGAASAELWAFDLAQEKWTRLSIPAGPGERMEHTMVFDARSGGFLLYGGLDNQYDPMGDLWSLDGSATAWRLLHRSSSPFPGGLYQTLAYDDRLARAVLIKYFYLAKPHNDTWFFDDAKLAWSSSIPLSPPTYYSLFKAAYDPHTGRVVVFGGFDTLNSRWSDDTWHYDLQNNTWTKMSPADRPSGRHTHAISYAGNGQALLFGGYQAQADTWLYNASAVLWRRIAPASNPGVRWAHAMAWDPDDRKVVLFGGLGGSSSQPWNLGDTWVFDPARETWTNLTPPISPSPRSNVALAYLRDGRFVLFGGSSRYGAGVEPFQFGDTWSYDLRNNTWANLTGIVGPREPVARYGANAVHLGRRGGALLFGGEVNGSGLLGDTWLFDPLPTNVSSPPRVVATSPAAGQNGVDTSAQVQVNFDQLMDMGPTAGSFSVTPPVSGGTVIVGGNVLLWKHTTPLSSATTYKVTISTAARSQSGINMAAPYEFVFSTNGTPAPRVVATSPGAGVTEVDPATNVTATFDQEMDPGPTASSFKISPPVAGGAASVSGRTLTWNQSFPMVPSTSYTVTISTSARSTAGVNMASSYSFTFWTRGLPPAPRVLTTSPRHLETGVDLRAGVTVGFDQPMDLASTASAFSISPEPAGGVATVSGKTLTWTHTAAFANGVTYKVEVSASARSASDVPMAGNHWFSFTTRTDAPAPPKVVSTKPAAGEISVDPGADVLVEFDRPMESESLVRSFSIAPATAGSVSVSLSSLKFRHDEPLASGTTYQVRISNAATSSQGASIEADHVFAFTTRAAGPGTGPQSDASLFASISAGAIILASLLAFLLLRRRGRLPARPRGTNAKTPPAPPGETSRRDDPRPQPHPAAQQTPAIASPATDSPKTERARAVARAAAKRRKISVPPSREDGPVGNRGPE